MVTRKELKSMVMEFSSTELQSLLVRFGRRRSHRKDLPSLRKEVLELIQQKRRPIRLDHKIQSMYRSKTSSSRRRIPHRRDKVTFLANVNSNSGSSDDTDNDDYDRAWDRYYGDYDEFIDWALDGGYCDCSSDSHYSWYDPQYLRFISTPRKNYKNVTGTEFTQFFSHFLVGLELASLRFVPLDSFEFERDILRTTPLIPKVQYDETFEFSVKVILDDKTRRVLLFEATRYLAVLRFCSLAKKAQLVDQLPESLSVKINNRMCPLSVCRHEGEPKSINGYLLQPDGENSLDVTWSADYLTLYGITIQLLRKLSIDDRIAKLERNFITSKNMIESSLNDGDNEIAATFLKSSLVCPLTKMLVTVPTRGVNCKHLQCFEASVYLQMNEAKSVWRCPVCNENCPCESLYVDGYFADILASDRFTRLVDCTSVQLYADGSWQPAINQRANPSIVDDPVNGDGNAESQCYSVQVVFATAGISCGNSLSRDEKPDVSLICPNLENANALANQAESNLSNDISSRPSASSPIVYDIDSDDDVELESNHDCDSPRTYDIDSDDSPPTYDIDSDDCQVDASIVNTNNVVSTVEKKNQCENGRNICRAVGVSEISSSTSCTSPYNTSFDIAEDSSEAGDVEALMMLCGDMVEQNLRDSNSEAIDTSTKHDSRDQLEENISYGEVSVETESTTFADTQNNDEFTSCDFQHLDSLVENFEKCTKPD